MTNHLKAELVTDALQMALWRSNPPSGVILITPTGDAVYGSPSANA
jgi:transposase InsO family protein